MTPLQKDALSTAALCVAVVLTLGFMACVSCNDADHTHPVEHTGTIGADVRHKIDHAVGRPHRHEH